MNTVKRVVMQAVRNEYSTLTDVLPMIILESEDAAQIYISAFPEDQRNAMRSVPVEYAPNLTEQHLPPRTDMGVVTEYEPATRAKDA